MNPHLEGDAVHRADPEARVGQSNDLAIALCGPPFYAAALVWND